MQPVLIAIAANSLLDKDPRRLFAQTVTSM
jgi:hypothetical protein